MDATLRTYVPTIDCAASGHFEAASGSTVQAGGQIRITQLSTAESILGPRQTLSPKKRALKAKVLKVILEHPDGIDTYDLAQAVNSDMATVYELCCELEREARVTGG